MTEAMVLMEKRIKADKCCTGCNACVAFCPEQAIFLKNNEEGFWYPIITEKACVSCGICKKICPVYGEKANRLFNPPIAYAGWNRNEGIRFRSSSGGMFSAIAESIIIRGGVIYGAAYTDNFSVEHIRVTTSNNISKLRGSKYVQSLITTEVYRQLAQDLFSGSDVLFSGTPCQCAAVKNRFKEFPNLITVDVICHGVPSPSCWKVYLDEVCRKANITDINMREKSCGWNKFHMVITYNNQTIDDRWFNDNSWGKSFVKNLFLRESCYACNFKEYIRCSDISLGDFWEAARGKHREFDDHDKGTSIILVNSDKGKEIIEHLSGCVIEKIPYDWIPERTYAVLKSSERNINRKKAFRMLSHGKGFTDTVNMCIYTNFIHKIINKVRKIIRIDL